MSTANTARLVLGMTGPLGSGVSTVSRALEEKGGFRRVTLSDPIKKELRKQENLAPLAPITSIPDWRKKLQDIGNDGRRKSPSRWLDEVLPPDPQPDADVVIDGIRNLGEVNALRDRYSRRFFVLAVHASRERRWERVKDDYDKNEKTFDRDDERDSDEDLPHGQQVAKCVMEADYILVNETDAGSSQSQHKQLFDRLEADIQRMRGVCNGDSQAFRRPPTADEVHMATAYAQAHMSRCKKRHVGAVIVSPRQISLSLGYNENPIGVEPCLTKYKFCFKDEDIHKKLEQMDPLHCPRCGHAVEQPPRDPWRCGTCNASLKSMLFPSRNMERCTAIHAEERAIRSLGDRSAEGGTIYATTFPCFQCARYIIDAGLKRVVYVEAYPVTESAEFLDGSGVSVEPFEGFKARAFNLIFKQVE